MKYYKLFIEFFLVSLIVSEILESAKLPASAKLPFLPLYIYRVLQSPCIPMYTKSKMEENMSESSYYYYEYIFIIIMYYIIKQ